VDKTYKPNQHEQRIYSDWESHGFFKPEASPKGPPFCIIMPPPNANDPLHTGHAMFVTVEDILIRYHRMKGDSTLWLPGTDHAGIETQYVFEKKLKTQGKSRFDFDRSTLYQMISQYVKENSDVAVNQMKRLGASADWSRFKFTLDSDIVNLILDTFVKLYQDRLLYRGLRLVNYCTHCGTGYSELEVEYQERNDPLYYLKYGPFTLATVRPETKFGDTAIAVHPQDKRYKNWVGKEVKCNGLIGPFKLKVIADKAVDPKFGTGAVKITPAHDPVDFEIGKRHHLELKQIINLDGKLNSLTGPYTTLTVPVARSQIVADLQKKGLIEKIDQNYIHRVGTCYRCHNIIEPLPLPQFFIKTKALAQKAIKSLDKKDPLILGAGWSKVLRHWLKNIKDWNISRQIVWGTRIPVWYSVKENPEIEVTFLNRNQKSIKGKLAEILKQGYSFKEIAAGLQSLIAPVSAKFTVSKKKPRGNYLQETDTFDTWFSSGQWPFVTLKTTKTNDFAKFYPTSVMETAYDILTRWVMRMILLCFYLTGKSPFKLVYLHGLVRDEHGRKMSKSIGNVINPLDLVDKYGTDALRMALVMSTTPGQDSSVGESKVKGMRNLANKIWNAARFIQINSHETATSTPKPQDKKFQKQLNKTIKKVSQQLDGLKIGQAAETAHNQFWHWFCDECIEQAKRQEISSTTLTQGLKTFLKLLHPFMPFVTEAIWQQLPHSKKEANYLIISPWPTTSVS